MSSATDRASEQVFLRLYPVIYPDRWRDQIQVVLFDNDQVPLSPESPSKEWPLTFEEHTDLIRHILELKPKAVFVDFLFDKKTARNAEAFEKFIAELPPDGPPVVFAAYADPKKELIAPLESLPYDDAAPGKPARRGLVELTAPRNHYQLSDAKSVSAAAVVYNTTVDRLNSQFKSEKFARVDTAKASDMLVAWGNTVPEGDAALSKCAPITTDPNSRWQALTAAIVAGVTNALPFVKQHDPPPWEQLQPCAYHRSIAPRVFFDTSGEALLQREAIPGSYVFIGAAFDGAGDTTVSPVHGQLPGVFLHAMALDNLLSFHGAYFKTPRAQTENLESIVQVVLIFLCYFAGRLAFADSPRPKTRLAALTWFGVRFAAWIAVAVLSIGLLMIALYNSGAPPYVFNWGSVLAIAGVIFFADAGRALVVLVRGGD